MSITSIIQQLKQNTISRADLRYYNIGNQEAINIAHALSRNTSLQELDLADNKIGDR